MGKVTVKLLRNPLAYLATTGLLILVIGGVVLLLLFSSYNSTRTLDLHLAVFALVAIALGQSFLITGTTAYLVTRIRYIPPTLPPLPQANIVALIPAYNERGNVRSVVEKAKRHVDLVLVVDDGSTDGTAEEAQKAGAVVVRHPRNMGYGAAVRTLMASALAAGAQYAVLLDADGQHDPDEIPRLLAPLREGLADVVIGNRFHGKVPTYRALGIRIIRAVLRLLGVRVEDPENGFRAFSRKALEILYPKLTETWMGISSETVFRAVREGLRVVQVPVTVKYGGDTSSENPLAHGLSIIWTLTWVWMAEKPVKRALTLGIVSLATSLGLLSYTITIFNTTRYIRLTYTTLAILFEVLATLIIATSMVLILTRAAYATR